ncbi:MAG: PfkB family carbohydrate kinase [bacterium]
MRNKAVDVVVGFSVNPEITMTYKNLGRKLPVQKRKDGISGTSADVAFWLKEFGISTKLLASVGVGDIFTEMVKSIKSIPGLSVKLLPIRERTPLAVVTIDEDEKTVRHYSDKAPVLKEKVADAKGIIGAFVSRTETKIQVVTGVMPEDAFLVKALFATRTRNQPYRIMNPRAAFLFPEHRFALSKILASVDIIVLNHLELGCFAGEELNGPESIKASVGGLHELGPKVVVVTCAERGAWLFEKDQQPFHQEATLVGSIKDDTGSGDAFMAGLITGRLSGWTFQESMPLAALFSAFSLTHYGGSSVTNGKDVLKKWHQLYPEARKVCCE